MPSASRQGESFSVGSVRLFRLAFGSLLLLAGFTLLAAKALAWLDVDSGVMRAFEGGALCALGTALGAVPVLVIRNMPVAAADTLLGFGAGVMLAATAFSLILPGLDAAAAIGLSRWGSGALASLGIMLGAFALYVLDRKVSGATPEALVAAPGRPMVPKRIWVFVIAIIVHNIPEGMAVGVSAGGGMDGASTLAIGIALQDVPEGLVIALVLAGAGMSRVRAFLIGAASGLVEPVFAVLCAWLVRLAELLLPLGLAFAGGAMLLVVTHEIIPESRSNGHHKLASLGLCLGFCLMMVLDTALG
ncbi:MULTISPECIES: ZIP family metal transporter [unclassified Pseudomonas]|uniref:ZIP family metal transporter n=1 Tax=unclassified Pseudomonas TaxID=196821 RepID=UPI000BDC6FE1|nr:MULTISPECIES: ZIP family metal transporter [unclassified Pseudomonas]PVZ12333.1 ZIP family zinc transporter [Pseudomonas sp. URIL14HWK12:I12]PVZ23515.1 ZIP family zinc transporter [Pseudomonas sp. URIL14HWK12:I10]PVZ32845.1 ZIP family zinc transporter [Pseudomonas sp. URIL14HWK12:I11]SNZ14243.1 zinc transporter, ZIP family [Pseudomonas sp. URIL14HWK12:I9]